MMMRRTFEKDTQGNEEEVTQRRKEEVEVEEESNPNRLSARQELPFLTLPSTFEDERWGGGGGGCYLAQTGGWG